MPIEKLSDGLWWPVGDRECHKAIFMLDDLATVLGMVRGRDVVVQAGGNCGVWANELAKTFNEVWTVEADLANYRCLVRNMGARVRPIWAALGDKMGTCGLRRYDHNVGAHVVDGEGSVPMITIDALELEACDLIILDIEGYEPFALQGAAQTIEKFKPVIMVEDRYGRFGFPLNWSHDWPGYKLAKKGKRDTIIVPREC